MTDLSQMSPPLSHLQPGLWQQVNRVLLGKALSEFAHESLIEPARLGQQGEWGVYALEQGNISYCFQAKQMALGHWHIDCASIERRIKGRPAELDVLQFIIEFRERLPLSETVLPVCLDEISGTLYSRAYKHAHQHRAASVLALADFQVLEAGMIEGHPVFLANNGRIGFSDQDHEEYAPETAAQIQLVWLAVSRQHAVFSHVDDLDYGALMAAELGETRLASYHWQLRQLGLQADGYWLMPVHPWQWHERLAIAFAGEIAQQRIVYLGLSEDSYQPQQSVRTQFNFSRPNRHYVKCALSILNLGFMRGLAPDDMQGTPAINQWLAQLVDGDRELQRCRFGILREVAAIGYRQPYYEAALASNSAHKMQLGCLWRESPLNQIVPGERLMSMAALLHLDKDGQALLPALIGASGLDAAEWLRSYLQAYLRPLLHCFYAHDLVFMPHGENLILVLQNHVPVRVLMKDIGEEISLLNSPLVLPAEVARISVKVPESMLALSIFTGIFDSFFRFLAPILQEHCQFAEGDFWREVAVCVSDYQQDHPEFAEKFVRRDLFAPRFARACLNRLQLVNNRQMINPVDPEALQLMGELDNPIAVWQEELAW